MPSDWYGGVTLLDDNQKKTTLRVVIGTITDIDIGAETITARGIFDAFLVDLKALTSANVQKAYMRMEDPGDWVEPGVPATGSDVSEEVALLVHTNDSFNETELATLRMPSPVSTIWVNDNYEEGLDVADPLVAAYVANFVSGALEFSDGENVNTAEGTSGVQDGFWRSRRMQIR